MWLHPHRMFFQLLISHLAKLHKRPCTGTRSPTAEQRTAKELPWERLGWQLDLASGERPSGGRPKVGARVVQNFAPTWALSRIWTKMSAAGGKFGKENDSRVPNQFVVAPIFVQFSAPSA